MNLIKKNKILLLIILLLTTFLRLYNLGYSDYVKDEHRTFYDSRYQGSFWEFALDQRKGPMQYIVAFGPKLIVGNFNNEFAQRLPFALMNIASVYVFYILIKSLTRDERVALTATALYSFNGFISGFGRIAQYQNLNLLFSLLAIYFYYKLANENKGNLRNAISGTLALCVSGLSHWDAIFIVAPVAYFWLLFLTNTAILTRTKIHCFLASVALLFVLVLPFLIPYIKNQFNYTNNPSYLNRRVGLNRERDLEFDFLIKLYNPFLSYHFYLILGAVGAIYFRKSWLFSLWFLVVFVLFYFFAAKPGTHVYNFLLPVFALCGIGFWNFYDFVSKSRFAILQKWRIALLFMIALSCLFMFYQSYRLFVESGDEYPWEDERILFLTAQKYQGKKVLPLFGFPHYRGWDQVRDFISEYNKIHNVSYTYDTNEDNSHISFYTQVDKSRSKNGFFYIGIKRPISFVNDWKPAQVKDKRKEKEIVVGGEIVTIIYTVSPPVN